MIEKLFRFQRKVINFVNANLIAYLNICTSVLIDTKHSVFFLIRKKMLDQNNSVGSEIIGVLRMKKQPENFNSKLLNLRKKLKFQSKFPKICILTFSVSVVEISNKHFCTLPSVKTLETLAKILHILTYSCLLLKVLTRSCLFLLHTNLLSFLILFLVITQNSIKKLKRLVF